MDKIRIRRADPRNLVIERLVKSKKVGNPPKWKVEGYYGTIEDLANALLDFKTKVPAGKDLVEQVRLLRCAVATATKDIVEEIIKAIGD